VSVPDLQENEAFILIRKCTPGEILTPCCGGVILPGIEFNRGQMVKTDAAHNISTCCNLKSFTLFFHNT
jgi:hypothetical protein